MAQIKAEYGSVMRFVVKERLCWGDGSIEDLRPRGGPFEYAGKERFCFWFLSAKIKCHEHACINVYCLYCLVAG